ncbi:MAG: hypothetical protein ABW057_00005, partial [Dehalococcoides mccartyi]
VWDVPQPPTSPSVTYSLASTYSATSIYSIIQDREAGGRSRSPVLIRVCYNAPRKESGMDINWIAIGSGATGLMALATFMSILQNSRHRKEDQRQRDTDEALELVKKLEESLLEYSMLGCTKSAEKNLARLVSIGRALILCANLQIALNRLRRSTFNEMYDKILAIIRRVDAENPTDDPFPGVLVLSKSLKMGIEELKGK